MGVLAGYSLRDVRRAMQHGHPQMTIADLLGNPLPADLVNAQKIEDIRISWRKWLGMRVKIVDEYNRIPTRTQSALLTVMGDNYAEILDQVYECPEAAWFLTAMPFILYAAVRLLSRDYFGELASSPVLAPALAYAALSLVIANVVIYRMVNFKI